MNFMTIVKRATFFIAAVFLVAIEITKFLWNFRQIYDYILSSLLLQLNFHI